KDRFLEGADQVEMKMHAQKLVAAHPVPIARFGADLLPWRHRLEVDQLGHQGTAMRAASVRRATRAIRAKASSTSACSRPLVMKTMRVRRSALGQADSQSRE